MHVVHISKVKGIAGSERHLLILLPALARQGMKITMLVLEDPRQPADPFCLALGRTGITCERLPIQAHFDPALVGRLTRRLRDLQPDIVHTHLLHADLYGLPAAHRAGVPHAISSRHNDNPFRRNPLLKWANQRAMRRAERVIAISHALAHFVTQVEGIDAARVATIHYGLDRLPATPDARATGRQTLGYGENDPLVGFFGRLIEQKGVDVLLVAFTSVRRYHPTARLLIAGDGDCRAELEALADALGLSAVVQFAGWREDAACLMPACDVLAMPSRWEGFGMVALEGMSAARPLVASRVSALPEIVIDGETGLLVPPGDPAALADAISSLLADPQRAAAMGQAGYERLASEFSTEKMVQATLAIYGEVINSNLPAK